MSRDPDRELKNQFDQLQQEQFSVVPNVQHRSKHYGNNIILTRDRYGDPSLMLGPHWYIFVFAFLTTITLILLLLYALFSKLSPFWFYTLVAGSLVYAYSYLRIGLSYPGFPNPPQVQPASNVPLCQVCGVIRSYRVYHCSDCNVCIEGYDHHCPWIGKCVGARNLCSFYFFLLMLFGILILCFVATLASENYRTSGNHVNGNIVVAG